MTDENINETQKEFIKPLGIKEEDKVKPLIFEADGNQYKIYVDKLGYVWSTSKNKGVANRVTIAIGKLNSNGDITGKKKQISIPSDISKENLDKIFKMIMAVKDKPLIKAE